MKPRRFQGRRFLTAYEEGYRYGSGAASTPLDTRNPVHAIKDIVITDAQWRRIKDSLRAVGINADQMTLRMLNGDIPLREALPYAAWTCALMKSKAHIPLPSEQANDLKAMIDRLRETLELLEPMRLYFRDYSVYKSIPFEPVRRELAKLIADLEHRRQALMASGSHRGKNTRKPVTEFWHGLTEEWLRLEPQAGHARRRHLQRFLLACADPFFPNVTNKAAATFVDRCLSKVPQKKV
jgi:hypothetical protein